MKKWNILALLVFAGVAVLIFTLDVPATRRLQQRTLAVFSPFIHGSASLAEGARAITADAPDPAVLAEENERLRQQVRLLDIIRRDHDRLIDENNELRRVLEFKNASPFKLTAARVVKRSTSTWWSTLIIDKGSLDGIAPDSPVITNDGLVGKTGKLTPRMAEVILLTDEMCRVSAKVEGSFEQGILYGERAGLDIIPNLHLRYLNRDAPIQPGASVLSSGEGGVFPANLMLGRVVRFENRDISGEAIVKPAVDFSRLEHVFVIEMQAVPQ
jgi:rod shape-determining protein MreC